MTAEVSISVLIPTRHRPEMVMERIGEFLSLATLPEQVEFILAIDEDDTSYDQCAFPSACSVIRTQHGNGYWSLGERVTALFAAATGKYLCMMTDDGKLLTQGWDTLVREAMKGVEVVGLGYFSFDQGNNTHHSRVPCVITKALAMILDPFPTCNADIVLDQAFRGSFTVDIPVNFVHHRFDLHPDKAEADSTYQQGPMVNHPTQEEHDNRVALDNEWVRVNRPKLLEHGNLPPALDLRRVAAQTLYGTYKMPPEMRKIPGFSNDGLRNLIRECCLSVGFARYLEVGVFFGATFAAALDSKEGRYIGIDDFNEFQGSDLGFFNGPSHTDMIVRRVECVDQRKCIHDILSLYGNGKAIFYEQDYHFITADMVKRKLGGGINVFFYDADHSAQGTKDGILQFEPAFADQVILVVDDFTDAEVVRGTHEALGNLGEFKMVDNIVIGNHPNDKAAYGVFVALLERVKKPVAVNVLGVHQGWLSGEHPYPQEELLTNGVHKGAAV